MKDSTITTRLQFGLLAAIMAIVLALGMSVVGADAAYAAKAPQKSKPTITVSGPGSIAAGKIGTYKVTVKDGKKGVKGAKVTFTWTNTGAAKYMEAAVCTKSGNIVRNAVLGKSYAQGTTNANGVAYFYVRGISTGASTATASVTFNKAKVSAKKKLSTKGLYTAGAGTNRAKYVITSKNTAKYYKCQSTNAKSASVPATIKIGGKNFKVIGIHAQAFKGTKVKTVTVKSKSITKATWVKNCFKGSKVTKVKIAQSSQKKIFAKKNVGKKVKIKK